MPEQLSSKLNVILKQTSRAFYLSLRVLPSQPRRALSLAYLLARAADTIADSGKQSNEIKAQALRALQKCLSAGEEDITSVLMAFSPEHMGERELLNNLPTLLCELTEDPDRTSIIEVVNTLIEGMLWDQKLFSGGSRSQGLSSEELERYTFLVAGCVGPFWSSVCAGDESSLSHLKTKQNLNTALEFGKALQWVNILRDIPEDQKTERFYLPAMSSREFTQSFKRHSHRALLAFRKAITYPNLYPVSCFRHRLSVFLPLVLGLRTLTKLFFHGKPRHGRRIKVKRQEVFFWLLVGPFILLTKPTSTLLLHTLWKRATDALEKSEFYHD